MTSSSYSKLFTPYKLGDITLKNRFVMASLTRMRADPKTNIPTELHAEYYAQRASAGLILTECAPISSIATSFAGAGGIYTKEQVAGWKKVTDAVHAKDGKIILQIWHAGRNAHPSLTEGVQPMAPSAIKNREPYRRGVNHVEPREMTKDDIKQVLEEFRQGAINAKQAGFDGIELHGSNGYLIDQFLRDGTNQRTDEFGGSAENRARFPLQALDILIEVFGAGRVGIKLSPVGRFQDMIDSDPFATYSYLLTELDKRRIAYVQLREPEQNFPTSLLPEGAQQMAEISKTFRPFFKSGAIMINESLTPEKADKAISEGIAELAAFGRMFISNPDYVERVENNWPFNELDNSTFYKGGKKGYTDYPFYDQKRSEDEKNELNDGALQAGKPEVRVN